LDSGGGRGAAIGFTYETNETNEGAAQKEDTEVKGKNDKLFVPDENLKLPSGMTYVIKFLHFL
jgi:hypothetical protein